MLDLSRLIGVAGGLALIYTAVAVAISGGAEWLATAMQWRSKNLYKGLRTMLLDAKDADGKLVVDKFFDHAVIQGMSKSPNVLKFLGPRLPSYIPAEIFAKVLPQLLMSKDRDRFAALTVDDLRGLVGDLADSPFKEALLTILSGRFDSIDGALKGIEEWYETMMQRVGGWYSRRMWSVTFVIGIATALFLRVDTIAIAERLWNDPEYRLRMDQLARDQIGTLQESIDALPETAKPASLTRPTSPTSIPPAADPDPKGASVAPAPKPVTPSPVVAKSSETPASPASPATKAASAPGSPPIDPPSAPPAGAPASPDPKATPAASASPSPALPTATPPAGTATPPAGTTATPPAGTTAPSPPVPDARPGVPGEAAVKSVGVSGSETPPASATVASSSGALRGTQGGDEKEEKKPEDLLAKLDALRTQVGKFDLEGAMDPKVPIDRAIRRRIDEIAQGASKADLPLGHDLKDLYFPETLRFLRPILGYLLTALAVSMGAKFWFELLSNVINVRIAGKRPRPDPPLASP